METSKNHLIRNFLRKGRLRVKIKIINSSDQDLNMAFLRNEFSKTFKEIFYDDVTYNNYIYIQYIIYNSYHMRHIYDQTET